MNSTRLTRSAIDFLRSSSDILPEVALSTLISAGPSRRPHACKDLLPLLAVSLSSIVAAEARATAGPRTLVGLERAAAWSVSRARKGDEPGDAGVRVEDALARRLGVTPSEGSLRSGIGGMDERWPVLPDARDELGVG